MDAGDYALVDHSDGAIPGSVKLTICIAVRALPVHRLGGLEHHARDLAVALARRGHSVHIVTTPGCARAKFGPEDGAITVHVLPGVAPADYSIKFFLRIGKFLERICRENQVDVLCPVDMAGMFVYARYFSAAVVPIIHGTMTSEVPLDWRYRQRLSLGGKVRALWQYKSRLPLMSIFRWMINRSETILVDSEFTRRELLLSVQGKPGKAGDPKLWGETQALARLAEQIHVVPLGIDPERYPQPDKKDSNYNIGKPLRIGLLGRLQKIKGIEIAIRAAAELRARGIDFRMTIGGSGSFEGEAELLIRQLGLSKFVRLVGRVAPEDIGKFMAKQHVFLFPDLTQPAFGLVAVEAMHHGLPVVAARVGAVPEVVSEDVGWLYNAWNVSELVDLLARVAADPGEISEKSAAAREKSSLFTAAKMADRTERALHSILRKKTG